MLLRWVLVCFVGNALLVYLWLFVFLETRSLFSYAYIYYYRDFPGLNVFFHNQLLASRSVEIEGGERQGVAWMDILENEMFNNHKHTRKHMPKTLSRQTLVLLNWYCFFFFNASDTSDCQRSIQIDTLVLIDLFLNSPPLILVNCIFSRSLAWDEMMFALFPNACR